MKKLKYLFLIMVTTFMSVSSVNAEIPSGEQYSEFATNRTSLVTLFTTSSDVTLYAYTPRLNEFLNGSLSLVRYENNYNDSYSNWAIRIYQSSRSSGNYTMNWATTWTDNSSANAFCNNASKPSPKGGVTNSTVCNVVGNTAYLSINYMLNTPDIGTAYVDFELVGAGLSINWFLRLVTAVYYPQIVESTYLDTETLTQQQQTIINQNQQQINQNNTIINQNQQTNDKLDDLNENITNDNVDSSTGSDFFDSFATNDNGGISAIVTAPLSAIEKMVSGTCSPIEGSYKGKTFSFPCGDTFWADLPDVKKFLNIVLGGFLCYGILAKLYLLIDRLKDPEDDRVDVMKL